MSLATFNKLFFKLNSSINYFSTSSQLNYKKSGRYGHKLVKKWEHPKYTIEPLPVYRTGGRLPNHLPDGSVTPGKVWCSRHGGGLDRSWFWVDHHRLTSDQVDDQSFFQEKVERIEADDNRSSNIALVVGPLKRRWILAVDGLRVGDVITNSAIPMTSGETLRDGDAMCLKLIPPLTKVCCLEFFPGKGAQISRSAGSYCVIKRHHLDRTIVTMPSGRDLNISGNCVAVIGRTSNVEHSKTPLRNHFTPRVHGLRPAYGIKGPRDGRFSKRRLPVDPAVVIGDLLKLTQTTRFEK